jgi:threonine dehydrogenase-like Zn-dependent dehydrogenase
MVRSEIGITGSFAYTPHDFQQAVDILASGKVKPGGSWLDERSLAACQASFVQLVDEQPAFAKIILHP